VFGPIGYVWSASRGGLPWAGGLTILTNDLVWWVPFALILRGAARAEAAGASGDSAQALQQQPADEP